MVLCFFVLFFSRYYYWTAFVCSPVRSLPQNEQFTASLSKTTEVSPVKLEESSQLLKNIFVPMETIKFSMSPKWDYLQSHYIFILYTRSLISYLSLWLTDILSDCIWQVSWSQSHYTMGPVSMCPSILPETVCPVILVWLWLSCLQSTHLPSLSKTLCFKPLFQRWKRNLIRVPGFQYSKMCLLYKTVTKWWGQWVSSRCRNLYFQDSQEKQNFLHRCLICGDILFCSKI